MEKDIQSNLTNTSVLVIINFFTMFLLFFIIFYLLLDNIYDSLYMSLGTSLFCALLKTILSTKILLELNFCIPMLTVGNNRTKEILNKVCANLELPLPKLHMINSQNINALVIGKSVKRSHLCLTKGALEQLNNDELEYLITYEMVQVKKEEMSFNTISMSTFGFVIILSDVFFRSILKAIQKRGKESESLMRLLITSFFLTITPFTMNMIYLMFPKYWEVRNDKIAIDVMGSQYTAYTILAKIDGFNEMNAFNSRACVNMCFTNSLVKQNTSKKYSKHIHINNRINAIKKL